MTDREVVVFLKRHAARERAAAVRRCYEAHAADMKRLAGQLLTPVERKPW